MRGGCLDNLQNTENRAVEGWDRVGLVDEWSECVRFHTQQHVAKWLQGDASRVAVDLKSGAQGSRARRSTSKRRNSTPTSRDVIFRGGLHTSERNDRIHRLASNTQRANNGESYERTEQPRSSESELRVARLPLYV